MPPWATKASGADHPVWIARRRLRAIAFDHVRGSSRNQDLSRRDLPRRSSEVICYNIAFYWKDELMPDGSTMMRDGGLRERDRAVIDVGHAARPANAAGVEA